MNLGPIETLKLLVTESIKDVIGLSAEQLSRNGVLVPPNKKGLCDLSLNVSKLNMFRKEGYVLPKRKPNEIADMWASQIQDIGPQSIERVEVDGSYINITFNSAMLIRSVVSEVLTNDNYGSSNIGNGETVYIEYSSPNIAKPFHAGHLRSTIIGSFLCKLHKKVGFNVISENYLGDWGKQYGLLALAYTLYGEEEKLESDPIKHLFELYVRINQEVGIEEKVLNKIRELNPELAPQLHYNTLDNEAKAYFKKMEDGDEEVLSLWSRMRSLSIEEYKKMYQRLNIAFDLYGGESIHSGEEVDEQLELLREANLLSTLEEVVKDKAREVWEERMRSGEEGTEQSDWQEALARSQNDFIGKYVDFDNDRLGKLLVTKKDGSSLYVTRDIAAAVSRWNKHNFSKMIYVVAVQQNLHFSQLFEILSMMGYDWANRCRHISFGLVEGMSTRKGNVVFLSDILDEAKEVMLDKMKTSEKSKFSEIDDPQTTADIVGMSAVFIQDMSGRREKGYKFDWERVTSFEGDTGPYLQYAHSRLCSIERKYVKQMHNDHVHDVFDYNYNCECGGEMQSIDSLIDLDKIDFSLVSEHEAHKLAYQIGQYPYAVQTAYKIQEASAIVNYLFGLCHAISSANSALNVLGAESGTKEARMALFHSARLVLKDGLKLLGLKPLHTM